MKTRQRKCPENDLIYSVAPIVDVKSVATSRGKMLQLLGARFSLDSMAFDSSCITVLDNLSYGPRPRAAHADLCSEGSYHHHGIHVQHPQQVSTADSCVVCCVPP